MITLTPRIEVIVCADAPNTTLLTPDVIGAVRRACAERGITHLVTPGGTQTPVLRWAEVQLRKISEGTKVVIARDAAIEHANKGLDVP